MCHDNEEWCKIWRGTDFFFQNWQEFDKFWPEHLKISKISTLMRSFWAEYILFELKKNYRDVFFYDTEEGYKIWRGIDLSFQSWHKEFDKFWHEHSIVSKIFTLMGSFWAKYILLEVKSREELSFMILKSDAEFEGNPTCGLENDMRPEYLRVPKLGLSWDPFVQSRKCMSLKFTEELCVMIMKNDTKLKRGWLAVLKLTWGIWQILTQALESLKKKMCFNEFRVTKVCNVWAKKVQRSYL